MSEFNDKAPNIGASGYSLSDFTDSDLDGPVPDPYESAAAWAAYRRGIAHESYQQDCEHAIIEGAEMPSESDYWYGTGFASVFAEKIGGSLDSFTTMPTPAAAVDFLADTYGPNLERPDCDYLANILREAFPAPGPRVAAALQWLEQKKAELPCWPPEKIGDLLVGFRKPGHYNRDSQYLMPQPAPAAKAPKVAQATKYIGLEAFIPSAGVALLDRIKREYSGPSIKPASIAAMIVALQDDGIMSRDVNITQLFATLQATLQITFGRAGLNAAYRNIDRGRNSENVRDARQRLGLNKLE